jgi:hypothetical protein
MHHGRRLAAATIENLLLSISSYSPQKPTTTDKPTMGNLER